MSAVQLKLDPRSIEVRNDLDLRNKWLNARESAAAALLILAAQRAGKWVAVRFGELAAEAEQHAKKALCPGLYSPLGEPGVVVLGGILQLQQRGLLKMEGPEGNELISLTEKFETLW